MGGTGGRAASRNSRPPAVMLEGGDDPGIRSEPVGMNRLLQSGLILKILKIPSLGPERSAFPGWQFNEAGGRLMGRTAGALISEGGDNHHQPIVASFRAVIDILRCYLLHRLPISL